VVKGQTPPVAGVPVAPPGFACESDGNECTRDLCGDLGFFETCFHIASGFYGLDGAACGSQADTVCDDPNTCSAGVCLDNFESDSYANVCNDSDCCTLDDHCDGAGGCHSGCGTPGHNACSSAPGGNVKDCSDGNTCTNDSCDPVDCCEHTYVCSTNCGDLLVRATGEGVGSNAHIFGQACYAVEVECLDATCQAGGQNGINCCYVQLSLGTAACPLAVSRTYPFDPFNSFDYDIDVDDDNFPLFQDGYYEEPFDVLVFGGCTNEGGVGTKDNWAHLGTIIVEGSQNECIAPITIAQSGGPVPFDPPFNGQISSLIGLGPVAADPAATLLTGIEMDCWGELYDSWPVAGDSYINAGDLSMFANCWMLPATGACAEFDYDPDGVVGPGDLSFFSTCWQQFDCAGTCYIHCDYLNDCPCAFGSNAMAPNPDGGGTSTYLPWASKEMIEEFGLPVPPRSWAGWKLDPDRVITPAAVREDVEGVRAKRAIGTR
jgi:hypothetical protein